MLNTVIEFFRAVFEVNVFTAVIVIGLGGVSYALVRFMTESLLLASLFAPCVMLGGIVSHHLFRYNAKVLTVDKDSNTVLTVAIGVLATLIVMIILVRLVNMVAERRMRVSRGGTNSLLVRAH